MIHETAAILLHIVDNYAAGTSFALTNETRTAVYQWLFYGASELEQGLWTAARHTFVLPEAERIPAAIQWGLQDFRNQLNYVSTMLGTKSYLLGDPFTVADLFITTILAWGKQAQKVDLEYENVKAYFERCQNRPGYQDSVAKYRRKS